MQCVTYFSCDKQALAVTISKCTLITHITKLNDSCTVNVPAKPGFRPGCLFFSYVFSIKEGIPDTVFPWSERRFPPLRAEWYTPRGIWFISCLTRAVTKVSRAALEDKTHELSRFLLKVKQYKSIIYSILCNLLWHCSLCCGFAMLQYSTLNHTASSFIHPAISNTLPW